MQFLNLGILAHVDAGKTSLTERLLHDAGVIDELGSVDAGNTQTDTLALERRRGITIKSAVVAFTIDDVIVNLIDTPGHPDFIAEVERVLRVLDGAVLVVSRGRGRAGADARADAHAQAPADPDADLRQQDRPPRGGPGARRARGRGRSCGSRPRRPVDRSSPSCSPTTTTRSSPPTSTARRWRSELAAQTRRALVHPVFLGSAITGAGVAELIARHPRPAARRRQRRRSRRRHRVQGRARRRRESPTCACTRARCASASRIGDAARSPAIEVFEPGGLTHARRARARARSARSGGLRACASATRSARRRRDERRLFAPPTLETVVDADGDRVRPARAR